MSQSIVSDCFGEWPSPPDADFQDSLILFADHLCANVLRAPHQPAALLQEPLDSGRLLWRGGFLYRDPPDANRENSHGV